MAAGDARHRGRGGLLAAAQRARGVLAFTFCWQLLYLAVLDCLNAFLYSMMSCPAPRPSEEGACPEGSFYQDGECKPFSRSSGHWSLSDRCFDKGSVVGGVTKLNGMLNFVFSGCSVLVTLLAGPIIDTRGRKPVMLAAFAALAVFCLLQGLVSSFATSWGQLVVVAVAANLILGLKSAQSAACNAMVADLSRGNSALRGDAYAALGMTTNAGVLSGFGLGYPILRLQLADYRWFWLGFVGVCLAFLALFCQCLDETLPVEGREQEGERSPNGAAARVRFARSQVHSTMQFEHSSSDEDSHDSGEEGFGTMKVGFGLLAGDRFLRQYLFVWAVIFTGFSGATNLTSTYLIAFLNYKQSTASVVFIVTPMVAFLGSAVSSPLIRHCGLHVAHGGSLAFIVVSFAICGLSGPLPELAAPLFWGGSLLGGLGFGVMKTCYRTTLSVRVEANLQGKLFAFSGMLNTVVATVLRLIWSQMLFQPKAHGWRVGLIWFASAGTLLAALLWYLALCLAHLDAPPPGKMEESSQGESTEDEEGEDEDDEDEEEAHKAS